MPWRDGGGNTWRRVRRCVALLLVAMVPSIASCTDAERAAQDPFTPSVPGVLRVATTLPAPGFWDGADPESVDGGAEWEIAVALADRFGVRLEIVPRTFAEIDAGSFGGADIAIAQLSVTDERADRLVVSIPYYETSAGVVMAAGEEMADLRAARDASWTVVDGSTHAAFVDEVVRPSGARGTTVVADEAEALRAVADGTVDAALVDLVTALALVRDDETLEVVAQFAAPQRYAIAIPVDDERAAANMRAVDSALRALRADGTIDDAVERWLLPLLASDPAAVPVIPSRGV